MSPRAIKIIVIVIILFALITGVLFFMSNKKGTGNPVTDIQSGAISFRDFSPFNPPKPVVPTEPPPTTVGQNPDTNPDGTSSGMFTEPEVRKVTDFAVSGFIYFQKERPLPPVVTEITPTEETTTTDTATTAKTPTDKKTPPAPTTEKVTALRYVRKSNAHISDVFLDKEASIEISNTTIPKIQEAFISPDGKSLILRYVNDATGAIQTYSGIIPPDPVGGIYGDLKGAFLPENIWWMTPSLDGTKLFALSSFGNGVVGDVSGITGDKNTQIFTSAFDEWLPDWVSAKTITLATKPSSNVPGYLYAINTTTKKMSRILGNIPGLTALMSPTEKSVLYTAITKTSVTMSLYDVATHNSKNVGINTLPEKCVWTPSGTTFYCAVPDSWPSGTYPDNWYQGTVSFSDTIWRIDISGGSFSLAEIATSADFHGDLVDATNLQLDATQEHLGFINKKDGTLWSIQL